MTTLSEVRDALADLLADAGGTRIETHALAPATINPPSIFPGPPTFTPADQSGGVDVTLPMFVVVPRTVDDWQAQLEALMVGPDGVCELVDDNATLGLDGCTVTWERVHSIGEHVHNDVACWGGVVDLAVMI